ncbi:MAG: hypothetical protein VYE77_00925 [Planctomycetota bacterium]|nr:hypothetical protein [Planctomycetota bacterium]
MERTLREVWHAATGSYRDARMLIGAAGMVGLVGYQLAAVPAGSRAAPFLATTAVVLAGISKYSAALEEARETPSGAVLRRVWARYSETIQAVLAATAFVYLACNRGINLFRIASLGPSCDPAVCRNNAGINAATFALLASIVMAAMPFATHMIAATPGLRELLPADQRSATLVELFSDAVRDRTRHGAVFLALSTAFLMLVTGQTLRMGFFGNDCNLEAITAAEGRAMVDRALRRK